MEEVLHDERTTSYREFEGQEPSLLFVHGSGSTHRVWDPQTEDLPYRTAVLDLSGHGESGDIDTTPGPETLNEYVKDVAAVAKEVDPDILVGNSLGGAVVMQTYLDGAVDAEALILTDTSPNFLVMDEVLEMMLNDFENVIRWSHHNGFVFYDVDDELLEWSIDMMLDCGAEVMHRDFKTCEGFDVRDRLREIDVPTLVIVGAEDKLTPPDFNREIAENVPNGKYVEIEECGHLSMLEKPDEFNRAIQDFVSST